MATDSEKGRPRTFPAFDPADQRYTACCRGCHIQTAALVVGFVELLWCVIQVFGLIRNWTIFGSSYIIYFLIGMLGVIMLVIVVLMLFYGIKIQSAFWVAPHLFCQVFIIIIAFVAAIIVLLFVIFGQYAGIRGLVGHDDYQMSDQTTTYFGIALFIFYLIVGLLEVWFLLIVYKLYRYLREKEVAENDRTRFVVSTAVAGGDDFYAPAYNNQWETSNVHQPSSPSFYPGSPEAGDSYPYGTFKMP
uniref:MARVEL domain-containing protein n=1 Tax=Plectus sambesii TaxID=2011161 RepID=A0A914UHV6_9BILA